MANRYNDQDYPHYYDRDDRYDSQTEYRSDEQSRRRRRDSGDNESSNQANYGSDFSRQTRSDEGDYTLYGYQRDSRYADRGGDYGSARENPPRRQPRRDDERRQNRQEFSNQQNYYGQGGDYTGTSEGGFDYEQRAARRSNNYDRDERGWWNKATDEMASWFGDDDAAQRRQRDARETGDNRRQNRNFSSEHRGRGPKNYRRSDERIGEEINDRLTEFAYLDASDIEVAVSGGEVTLTGAVESRYAKRMAENIAENVSGVNHVENRLRVKQPQNQTSYAAQQNQSDYSKQNQAGYTTANKTMNIQDDIKEENEFPQSAGTFGSREDLAANYGQQGLVSTTGTNENNTTETETRETNVETMRTVTLKDSPDEEGEK